MRIELTTGETIYVDSDAPQEIMTGTWRRNGNTSRVYRNRRNKSGKVIGEALADLIMGISPSRGEVWGRRDGDWRNFTRDNLILIPRASNLMRQSSEQRRCNARKAARTAKKRGTSRNSGNTNPHGLKGVAANGHKFKAMAVVAGKQRYLGLFETPEQAGYAYDLALKAEGLEPVNKPALDDLAAEAVRQAVTKKLEQWV